LLKFFINHRNLSFIAFLSVFCVICFDFIFSDSSELFYGGSKVADIMVNMSISYIAGLIFYILTVYLPAIEKKAKTAPLAKIATNRILQKVNFFLPKEYNSQKLLQPNYLPNPEVIDNWLSNTCIHTDSAIGTMKPGIMFSYQQAIERCLVHGILEEIEKTSFFIKNLEPDFVAELYSIKRASICEYITSYPAKSWDWENDAKMSHYNTHLLDLLKRVSKLVLVTDEIYS
jgi:hypothetical protein